MQSTTDSVLESITNILIRAPINMSANYYIFPLLGYEISLTINFTFMVIFTVISFVTSFLIRRLFNHQPVYKTILRFFKNES